MGERVGGGFFAGGPNIVGPNGRRSPWCRLDWPVRGVAAGIRSARGGGFGLVLPGLADSIGGVVWGLSGTCLTGAALTAAIASLYV